jgi:hypothetical protein
MSKELNDLLSIDPIAVAEKIMGLRVSAEIDNPATLLALSLQFKLSKERKAVLLALGDTTFSNEQARYEQIITDMGFVHVYKAVLLATKHSPDTVAHIHVWANPNNGCILVYDTYSSSDEDGGRVARINGAHVHYCWKPNEGVERSHFTASGGLHSIAHPDWRRDPQFFKENEDGSYTSSFPADLFWSGYHDAREALRHNLTQLAENGEFFAIWPRMKFNRFMFLVNRDFNNESVLLPDEIAKRRLEELPTWVRAIINCEY